MALINSIKIINVMKKLKSNSLKDTSKNIASLVMETDPFDVEKLTDLVSLGNDNCDEDKAADMLDIYLDAGNNTLMDAYFDIIESYDKKFGFLKLFGYSIDNFKAEITEKINNSREKETDKNSMVQLDT